MANIKIKGKSYTLGDLPFDDSTIDLFGSLMKVESNPGGIDMQVFKDLRLALHKSIESGSGKEKADKAMADMAFSMQEDSDLMRALAALAASLSGE